MLPDFVAREVEEVVRPLLQRVVSSAKNKRGDAQTTSDGGRVMEPVRFVLVGDL